MDIKKVATILGVGAIVSVTGGLAAPVLLYTPIANGLSAIVAIGVVKTVNDAKKSKKENERLREELKKSNLDNKQKQHIIEKLNRELEQVKSELNEERTRSRKNEERIKLMEEQINDLIYTIQVAQVA